MSEPLEAESPVDAVFDFLERNKDIYMMRDPLAELRVVRHGELDEDGTRHVKFEQLYEGIPVLGGTIGAHFNREGVLYLINGTYYAGIDLTTRPAVSADDVLGVLGRHLNREEPLNTAAENPAGSVPERSQGFKGVFRFPTVPEVINRTLAVYLQEDRYHLVWQVFLRAAPWSLEDNGEFIIEAHTGEVLRHLPGIIMN